jgi:hypothetical protein
MNRHLNDLLFAIVAITVITLLGVTLIILITHLFIF